MKYIVIIAILIYIRNINSISIGLNRWWLKIYSNYGEYQTLVPLYLYIHTTVIPTHNKNDYSPISHQPLDLLN